MPRANRHHVPSQIWHITHRCHQKDFLLKFSKDRKRWLHWLFEAKKRFDLTVLNYMVTSNHIHLLVEENDKQNIAQSVQLIAGRIGQEYNKRKKRKGAFWEDRYHATAIDTNEYLIQCIAYIDLNMVRAGVVKHPKEWMECGYHEIQNPPKRYAIINRQRLAELAGVELEKLAFYHHQWIESELEKDKLNRQKLWTNNVAVGSRTFAESFTDELSKSANYKHIIEENDCFVVRE